MAESNQVRATKDSMERVEPQDLLNTADRQVRHPIFGTKRLSHEETPSQPPPPCFFSVSFCMFLLSQRQKFAAWSPRCVLDRIWQRVDLLLHTVAPRSSTRHPGKLPLCRARPSPRRSTPRCHGRTRPECHGRAQHLVSLRRWKAREPSSGPKHPRPFVETIRRMLEKLG